MKNRLFIVMTLVLLLLVTGVNPAEAAVKIGILPDADSIPLIVAQEEGFLAEAGYDIQVVKFNNPIERDSALQAGQIDGAISDVLAAAIAVDNGFDVKITSLTTGRYVLLGAPGSGITDYQDLEGVQIAISTNTIIEYVTDRLLKEKGFTDQEIAKIAIPKMPVRMQMLEAGKVKAACLPEPLASIAMLSGAVNIGSSEDLGEAPGIMLFTRNAVKEKSAEIKAFYKAYNKAIPLINKNPDSYRELLVSKGGFPEAVKDTFKFPHYEEPELPQKETVDQVIEWVKEKELVDGNISYEDIVSDRFI